MTGLGTSTSPCQVTTCDQLQAVSQASVDYQMANDIDCSVTSTWSDGQGNLGFIPIAAFNGVFDGNGYTVANLYESNTNGQYLGLFGVMNATIENIELTNVSITGGYGTAGLAGDMQGGLIQNAFVTGSINGDNVVGGLVGNMDAGTITGSTVQATVTASGQTAGGIVAIQNGTVTGCNTAGSITAQGTAGGISGNQNKPISSSWSSMAVSVTVVGTAGGLSAQATGAGTITDSYATGTVTGTSTIGATSYIGGLVGYTLSTVQTSYATGNVSADGTLIGGLVGNQGNGAITDSYARGNVTTTGLCNGTVGGLVGVAQGPINRTYSSGTVTSVCQVAGILGGGGTVSNSFAVGLIVSPGTKSGGLVNTTTTTNGAWYDAPGTDATFCNGDQRNSNMGCVVETTLAYFYGDANVPMNGWSFGPTSAWSTICNGLGLPTLTFQNLTSCQ